MADTIREQIIAAFVTRAGFWLTAGGFTHNCGSTVQRGIPHVDENDLPACIVLPQIEEVTQQYGVNACKMNLRVEAVAAIGTTNPSIVQEQLLGDVIKLMTDPAVTVTALIDDILYTTGGPASGFQGEDTTVAVFAEFTITYETLSGNPYSQGS